MTTIGIHICRTENTISPRASFPDSLYWTATKLYWYCPNLAYKATVPKRVNHEHYWRTMPPTHCHGLVGSRLHALAIEASNESGALQWRYNGCDGVPNHQPHYCLLNCLFWRRSKKTPKPRATGLVWGIHRWQMNSPHKMASKAEIFPFDDVIMCAPRCCHQSCDCLDGCVFNMVDGIPLHTAVMERRNCFSVVQKREWLGPRQHKFQRWIGAQNLLLHLIIEPAPTQLSNDRIGF